MVFEGLEVSAVTPTAAIQGIVSILHEIAMFDGLKVAEDIKSIEARGGRVFVTFKTPATCSMFTEHVGPVLQQNHDQIQHQLRPVAARGAYVLARAWMCRKRYRDMSAYAPGGRGRGRGRPSGHSSGRSPTRATAAAEMGCTDNLNDLLTMETLERAAGNIPGEPIAFHDGTSAPCVSRRHLASHGGILRLTTAPCALLATVR